MRDIVVGGNDHFAAPLRALAREQGIDLRTASTAADVLAACREKPPPVVLLWWTLADEVLAARRSEAVLGRVPVAVLVPPDRADSREALVLAGASEVFIPPVTARQVWSRLQSLATRAASEIVQARWPAAAPSLAILERTLREFASRPGTSGSVPARVVEETWAALGKAEQAALRLAAGREPSPGEREAAPEDVEVLCAAASRVLLARLHLKAAERTGLEVDRAALAAVLSELDAGLAALRPVVARVMRDEPALLRPYGRVSLVLQQHRTALENVARRLRGEAERELPGAGLAEEARPVTFARAAVRDAPLVREPMAKPVATARRGFTREQRAWAAIGGCLALGLLVHLFVLDTFGLFGARASEDVPAVPGVVRLERRPGGTRVVVASSFDPARVAGALPAGVQQATFVDEQGFPVAMVVNGNLMRIPPPMGAREGGAGRD